MKKGIPLKELGVIGGENLTIQFFFEFCHSLGIKHEFSTPRTPQQNRVVERKNCVLQEMARTMLNQHEPPTHF